MKGSVWYPGVIIPVSYRIKSHVGAQFSIRATPCLGVHIILGFVMEDELVKQARNCNFDEPPTHERDIRMMMT